MHYFKPYYCLDNIEDVFVSGSSSTYDVPRAYLSINVKVCQNEEYCEKDPIKRRHFFQNLRIHL